MSGAAKDRWDRGNLYDPYVGRWSRKVAASFVPWLEVASDRKWLDVGCGTGALVEQVLRDARPRSVKGIDSSAAFLDRARMAIRDGRATFEVGDARALAEADGAIEAIVSGLVINFVPQPERAAAEMWRVLDRGGVGAAYLWDYAGKMQLMRHFWNAAAALDPSAREKDEGLRFALCEPKAMRELWEGAGFRDVQVAAIDVDTTFRDFDDYWTPFLSGQAPAPGYCMSLSEEARARLRERLRDSLPFATDGTIPLVARAWAVKGRK